MQLNKRALVDFCVLTAGRYDMLQKCLDSIQTNIQNSSVSCNVYLYDNGTPVQKRLEWQKLLEHPVISRSKRSTTNDGFPYGANACIAMGSAPLVFFITDDVELFPGTLDVLVKRMNDASIGECGLKLLFPVDSTSQQRPAGKVQHVGHSVTVRGDIIHQFVGWSRDNPRCCQSGEVFSVTGAAFMTRRDLFNRVRGFDLEFGAGTFEDVALSLNIRQLGYKIYIDTDALAYHYTGATAEMLQKGFPLETNRNIFMSKYRKFLVYDDWRRR